MLSRPCLGMEPVAPGDETKTSRPQSADERRGPQCLENRRSGTLRDNGAAIRISVPLTLEAK